MDCIFCKIVNGEIPSNKVYEDDKILAFRDVSPVAPQHILVIPKEHITSAAEINAENSGLIARIYEKTAEIAKEQGFSSAGFRVVTNIGADGGQSVGHLHFHILAGKAMGWPPFPKE